MQNIKQQFLQSIGQYIEPVGEGHDQNVVNIVGAKEASIEILTLESIRSIFRINNNYGIPILVFSRARDFNHWKELIQCNLPDLDVLQLPQTSYWSNDRYSNQVRLENQRTHCIARLAMGEGGSVVLSTVAGLMQATVSLNNFRNQYVQLKLGEEKDLFELLKDLEELGYLKVDLVTEPGVFALRGGILDVFSLYYDDPIRIEFLGDEIVSIRVFSLERQTSTSELKSAVICPAQECSLGDRKNSGQVLHEYLLNLPQLDRHERQGMVDAVLKGLKFPAMAQFYPVLREGCGDNSSLLQQLKGQAILSLNSSLQKTVEAYEEEVARTKIAFRNDIEAGVASLDPDLYWSDYNFHHLNLILEQGNPYRGGYRPRFSDYNLYGHIEPDISNAIATISRLLRMEKSVVLVCHSSHQVRRLEGVLESHEIPYQISESSLLEQIHRQELGLVILEGYLSGCVDFPLLDCLLIPEHSFFSEERRRLRKKAEVKGVLSSFRDLRKNSLVVHIEHGIGRYLGMKSVTLADANYEFLVIEYKGGDKIYLPVDKLALLQKYSASGGEEARLDSLKSQAWAKKKARVKGAIKEIAEDLLKLHAKRKLSQGNVYSRPSDLYFQMEADFPYDETDDQLRCIDEVNQDLSSSTPMDRLVCGDVGFGKTEVAIRAAMRVVVDGFQVMVLAPTTILSYQHFKNFQTRFSRFGISVELLNRFIKPKQAKEIIRNFSDGRIDVLLGTHRLLSKDITPKRLGLVVVDEEQRFGVTHKEKIKDLKANCDILTLTATPIPRSLHMSLVGLRDISTIMTPPRERLEVKTYVSRWQDKIITEAIERELERGGQIFFVHNRVSDILEISAYLKNLCPTAKIRIGHGQMSEKELENVVVDFLDQKFNLLVCTTIIESGIDMPNVNTMIVNDADRFGLAQLYQLRGRVGRSSRQSYAYFLTKSSGQLTEDAQQRLEVLAAHQELGSGFLIANYDLELRGAGDLLGGAQSGHVSDVGFDLYTQLLEEEIRRSQGDNRMEMVDPEIKVSVDAILPPDYIQSEQQRLSFYKRIFSSSTIEDLGDIRNEMQDQYGVIPESGKRIFIVAEIKLLLKKLRVSVLSSLGELEFELKFSLMSEGVLQSLEVAKKMKPRVFKLQADYSMIIDVTDLQKKRSGGGLELLCYALDILSNY